MNYYIQKEIVKRDDGEPAEIYVLYGDGCKITADMDMVFGLTKTQNLKI